MQNDCPLCHRAGTASSRLSKASVTDERTERTDFVPSSASVGWLLAPARRCAACSHEWVPVSDVAIEQLYANAEFADSTSADEDEGRAAYGATIAKLVKEHAKPDGLLLEVGSWTGHNLLQCRSLIPSLRILGVEPSVAASAHANSLGIESIPMSFAEFLRTPRSSELTGTVDVVLLLDVIEHVRDPRDVLEQLRQLLSPTGMLILSTPRADSGFARVLRHKWWSIMPMHVQYFSKASLTSVLQDAGFVVTSCRTDPKPFPLSYYVRKLGSWVKFPNMKVPPTFGDRPIAPDFRDRLLVLSRPQ